MARQICCYCRRRVYRQRNGAWYHYHNGSVSCRPGEGSDRRATPVMISTGDEFSDRYGLEARDGRA